MNVHRNEHNNNKNIMMSEKVQQMMHFAWFVLFWRHESFLFKDNTQNRIKFYIKNNITMQLQSSAVSGSYSMYNYMTTGATMLCAYLGLMSFWREKVTRMVSNKSYKMCLIQISFKHSKSDTFSHTQTTCWPLPFRFP